MSPIMTPVTLADWVKRISTGREKGFQGTCTGLSHRRCIEEEHTVSMSLHAMSLEVFLGLNVWKWIERRNMPGVVAPVGESMIQTMSFPCGRPERESRKQRTPVLKQSSPPVPGVCRTLTTRLKKTGGVLKYMTSLNTWHWQFYEEENTMALDTPIYRALEDILGPDNITEEPAILDAYAWRSGMAAGTTKFMPRFEIVVLPKGPEEVQAIIRLCNRFRIQFKPTSTLWGPGNCPGDPGVILIDLRRMNRLLEINEKNMYAVLEPYVIGAQLQAELMKRGLTCNLNGAGSHVSAFAFAGR